MSSPASSPELALCPLERAHYDAMAHLYMPHQRPAGGLLARSEGVDDPEWNHLRRDMSDQADWSRGADAARRALSPHGLRPVLVVGAGEPGPGWTSLFVHWWGVWRGGAAARVDLDDAVSPVRDELELEAYIASFMRTYADDEPDPGYGALLRRSFQRRDAVWRALHYVARWRGRVVGGATTMLGPGFAGLYNLVIEPEARRRGLGRALTLRRVRDAQARGVSTIFLQTADARVEALQRRSGFEFALRRRGWAPP